MDPTTNKISQMRFSGSHEQIAAKRSQLGHIVQKGKEDYSSLTTEEKQIYKLCTGKVMTAQHADVIEKLLNKMHSVSKTAVPKNALKIGVAASQITHAAGAKATEQLRPEMANDKLRSIIIEELAQSFGSETSMWVGTDEATSNNFNIMVQSIGTSFKASSTFASGVKENVLNHLIKLYNEVGFSRPRHETVTTFMHMLCEGMSGKATDLITAKRVVARLMDVVANLDNEHDPETRKAALGLLENLGDKDIKAIYQRYKGDFDEYQQAVQSLKEG